MKGCVWFVFTLLAMFSLSPAANASSAHCDFNGDGFDDLATNDNGSNSIQVLYGRATGLSATNNQLLSLGEAYGGTLACADFNGDSVDDLAVGSQYANIGDATNAGTVAILFGSRTWRLTKTGMQLWNENSAGGTITEIAQFGAALAPGDFNGDGYTDLAIGAPGKPLSFQGNVGVVYILYGSATGLTGTGSQILNEDVAGMSDATKADDHFGASLAAGNFGKDTTIGCYDDLVIGVPGEDVNGIDFAGAFHVVFGSSTGITTAESEFWTEDSGGVPGSPGGNEQFGFTFAVANFRRLPSSCGGTIADLAVGSRKKVGTVDFAGAAYVFYGTNDGLSSSNIQMWTQNSSGIADYAEWQDFFATSLAAGHTSAGDFLVIGTPDETLGTARFTGVVQILFTDPTTHLLTAAGSKYYSQNTSGIKDSVEIYDYFGYAVATGDYNADGQDDVAIGAPGESFNGMSSVGAVHVLYSAETAFTQFFHQNATDIKGVEQAGDSFGQFLP